MHEFLNPRFTFPLLRYMHNFSKSIYTKPPTSNDSPIIYQGYIRGIANNFWHILKGRQREKNL